MQNHTFTTPPYSQDHQENSEITGYTDAAIPSELTDKPCVPQRGPNWPCCATSRCQAEGMATVCSKWLPR